MTSLPLCSDGSAALSEQLAGSAPTAAAWVALEQNGPWGARALTESHLDPLLGRAIEEHASGHGVRVVLVRRPGRHADLHVKGAPRRVLVGHTLPGGIWLLDGTVEDPAELLGLDWAAAGAGDLAAVRRALPALTPSSTAHLLVCTNGTRDLCCAVKGRPLALALHAARPDQVWEVTHTSGHRFAPTVMLLPAGTLHGRLDVPAAVELLDAAARGHTLLAGHRGRSCFAPPAQAADLAVRALIDETSLDAVHVAAPDPTAEHRWTCAVRHRDGRRWLVDVASVPSGDDRAESCAKDAVPLRRWRTRVHVAVG